MSEYDDEWFRRYNGESPLRDGGEVSTGGRSRLSPGVVLPPGMRYVPPPAPLPTSPLEAPRIFSRGLVPVGMCTSVASNNTITILNTVQARYRPHLFVIDREIAYAFMIEDIRVGNRSQFVNAEPVPASCFPFMTDDIAMLERFERMMPMLLDTVQIGQNLIVVVRNTSAANFQFKACFWGRTAE